MHEVPQCSFYTLDIKAVNTEDLVPDDSIALFDDITVGLLVAAADEVARYLLLWRVCRPSLLFLRGGIVAVCPSPP